MSISPGAQKLWIFFPSLALKKKEKIGIPIDREERNIGLQFMHTKQRKGLFFKEKEKGTKWLEDLFLSASLDNQNEWCEKCLGENWVQVKLERSIQRRQFHIYTH